MTKKIHHILLVLRIFSVGEFCILSGLRSLNYQLSTINFELSLLRSPFLL